MGASATSGYDRTRLMANAASASKKGRRRRAIALYQRVLAVEPNNLELHQKLAPLLAEAGRAREAVESTLQLVRAERAAGRHEPALALLRSAVTRFPGEVELWEAIADCCEQRGRAAEAVAALREGLSHLRRRRYRGRAVRLLRRLYRLDPGNLDVGFELVVALRKLGLKDAARSLLAGLSQRIQPGDRRRLRTQEFWLRPTPTAAWRWLRA